MKTDFKTACVYIVDLKLDGEPIYCGQPVYENSSCCKKHHEMLKIKADKFGPRA